MNVGLFFLFLTNSLHGFRRAASKASIIVGVCKVFTKFCAVIGRFNMIHRIHRMHMPLSVNRGKGYHIILVAFMVKAISRYIAMNDIPNKSAIRADEIVLQKLIIGIILRRIVNITVLFHSFQFEI